jgi:hypothetical protein
MAHIPSLEKIAKALDVMGDNPIHPSDLLKISTLAVSREEFLAYTLVERKALGKHARASVALQAQADAAKLASSRPEFERTLAPSAPSGVVSKTEWEDLKRKYAELPGRCLIVGDLPKFFGPALT